VWTLRFVQAVCLALAIVCGGLVAASWNTPTDPARPYDMHVAWLLCLAAIVGPNAGMVWYLRRYVLQVDVTADRLRITHARLLLGRWTRELVLADVLGTQYVEGRLPPELERRSSVDAPWTWLYTSQGRLIMDEQGEGSDRVQEWLGQVRRDAPKVRR
jgi:hypothetical protein